MPLDIKTLGYVGFDNLGDEAILAGLTEALRQRPVFREATITALSADPLRTRALHPGIQSAPRRPLRSLARRMRGTDLFVLGGGSLFQDATSIRSVLWYALAARFARAGARKVLWWGHGIGPLNSPIARRLVAMTARQADAITVRDPASARLLKDCGYRGSVELVPDPAFLLPLPDAPVDRAGTVVAWRSWSGRSGPPSGAWFPEPVRTLPMHPPDAGALPDGERIDWTSMDQPLSRVLSAVASARLVVAVRLHALIFSVVVGTPFVAISYDPKVAALAEATGQQDACIALDECDASRLDAATRRVLDQWPQRHAHLAELARRFRSEAARPAVIAEEWFA